MVRCRGVRPSDAISASIRSGANSWPCSVPAAREMLSFISVPPRSLAPASRQAAAPSGPSFTQDTWMFGISGCSTSRATACISTVSRNVGPLRRAALEVKRRLHVHERQRHELGEAAGARLEIADVQQVPRPMLAAGRYGRT